ncbi:MAG: nickel pincer cofactor biosynthesis protein LarB [Longimicrobiaceae bacterium]
MNRATLAALLGEVADGRIDPEEAARRLAWAPVEHLPFATLDHHRALRHGFPEVILGQGKTPEQIAEIAARLAERGGGFLATRLTPEAAESLAARFPRLRYHAVARTAHLPAENPPEVRVRGTVLVVSAGTGDLPVAEEAAITAEAFGNPVARLHDVGVAGIHRVLAAREAFQDASVVVVVAGMEGALPSVVGGLITVPVIAVPTSVGYGASFGGLAALLAMLNSCASGVTVVNIDNGFGAGAAASRINKVVDERRR